MVQGECVATGKMTLCVNSQWRGIFALRLFRYMLFPQIRAAFLGQRL